MTEEEKKAIKNIEEIIESIFKCEDDEEFVCDVYDGSCLQTALNLIQKQDTEINKLKEENERLKYACAKATEIIDEYTNETEMDTKKLIEYQEKHLNNK